MTQPPERPVARTGTPDGVVNPSTPTLPEDLLLLLFQPDSGTIAGETTLFYVLAGAVLADLALHERVTATTTRSGAVIVEAVDGRSPSDEILRPAWDYVSDKPRAVQTILAAIGPPLRQPLLERLLARGDIREENGKVLGLFTTAKLKDGGSGRRAILLGAVRDVLVDGTEPSPRDAALTALLWGSGALSQFDPEIPWTSTVLTRAQELEAGNWSAGAAAEAVNRTMTAIVVNSVVVAVNANRRK